MVRPKTHTRESSRGMLTLTEEEASRRSGGSPAQSPCHSLPSGGPRRRESEPIGPQRPVRGTANHRRAQLSGGALAGRRRGVELLYHWPVTGGRSAVAAPPHLPAGQREDKSSMVTEIQQEGSAGTCRFTWIRSGGPRWSLRVHLRTTSSVLLMVGFLDPAGFVLLLSVKTTAPPCPRCRPSCCQARAAGSPSKHCESLILLKTVARIYCSSGLWAEPPSCRHPAASDSSIVLLLLHFTLKTLKTLFYCEGVNARQQLCPRHDFLSGC